MQQVQQMTQARCQMQRSRPSAVRSICIETSADKLLGRDMHAIPAHSCCKASQSPPPCIMHCCLMSNSRNYACANLLLRENRSLECSVAPISPSPVQPFGTKGPLYLSPASAEHSNLAHPPSLLELHLLQLLLLHHSGWQAAAPAAAGAAANPPASWEHHGHCCWPQLQLLALLHWCMSQHCCLQEWLAHLNLLLLLLLSPRLLPV
jgi:hypothetical protein